MATLEQTTIRLPRALKRQVAVRAAEMDTSFQQIVTKALQAYLVDLQQEQARQIMFKTHNLGAPVHRLTRDDIYGDDDLPC